MNTAPSMDDVVSAWMLATPERKAAALRALTGDAPAQPPSARLLKICEAAAELGYSRTHTHRLIRRGLIQTVTPYDGALPRVPHAEVLRFAAAAGRGA